jgi:hypothetical protein
MSSTNGILQIQFLNQNQYQNAGQTADGFSNNLRYCTVDGNPVTAEEFNTKIGGSGEMARSVSSADDTEDEPLFGTHLREAATTLKKIFRR